MGEVSESEGVAAQGFQSPVDRFGGPVGGVVVKEGQDVGSASPQGAAELDDLLQPAGTPRRRESINLVIARLPRRRLGSA